MKLDTTLSLILQSTLTAILFAFTVGLAGCGGGGGGNSPTITQQPSVQTQPVDTDGDGVADAIDAFPNDATETVDTDGDGVGDNADAFPRDASRSVSLFSFPLSDLTDPLVVTPGHVADQFIGQAHYSTSHTSPNASGVQHMPIYSHGHSWKPCSSIPCFASGELVYGKYLHVGIDQGNHIGSLPLIRMYDKTAIRYGHLTDGVGATTLADYLRDATDATIERYDTPPDVRVIGPASTLDIELVAAAVGLVNAALPEAAKMRMGTSLPNFSLKNTVNSAGLYFYNGQELDNTIQIEFIPSDQFSISAGAIAWNHYGNGGELSHSYIQFNKGANVYQDLTSSTPLYPAYGSRRSVILLAHELMHALGFYGADHVAVSFDTILEGTGDIYEPYQGGLQPRSLLWSVDREALQALYSRLEDGDNPTDFGSWSARSLHIIGNSQHSNFGVALRNGYAEPWAYGYRPNTDLAANPVLSSSVAWTGELLGLTPDAIAVAGDASIRVNLTSMTGQTNFTNLEAWGVNTAPDAKGTGTIWGDGDLGYNITVRGNTFRETGGDHGRLTGIFTGNSHDGVAGTLERSDLAAAFGATR